MDVGQARNIRYNPKTGECSFSSGLSMPVTMEYFGDGVHYLRFWDIVPVEGNLVRIDGRLYRVAEVKSGTVVVVPFVGTITSAGHTFHRSLLTPCKQDGTPTGSCEGLVIEVSTDAEYELIPSGYELSFEVQGEPTPLSALVKDVPGVGDELCVDSNCGYSVRVLSVELGGMHNTRCSRAVKVTAEKVVVSPRQIRGQRIIHYIKESHAELHNLLETKGTTKISIEGWEDGDSLDIDMENHANTTAFEYFGSIPFDPESPFMQCLSSAKFEKVEDGVAIFKIRRDFIKGPCTAPKQPGSEVTITEYQRDSEGITFSFEAEKLPPPGVKTDCDSYSVEKLEQAIQDAKDNSEYMQDLRDAIVEACKFWNFTALDELAEDCDPELTSLKSEITTGVLEYDAPDYSSLEMFTHDILTAIKGCVEHHALA